MDDFILPNGLHIAPSRLIGSGTEGHIFRLKLEDNTVLKTPKRLCNSNNKRKTLAEHDDLSQEIAVYERLGSHPLIAEYLGPCENGFMMRYYPKGSLLKYLRTEEPGNDQLMRRWMLEIAQAVSTCHDRGIVVNDIGLSNILVDNDLHLRLADFNLSILVPGGGRAGDKIYEGGSVSEDLIHVGSVMYSIALWKEPDSFDNDQRRTIDTDSFLVRDKSLVADAIRKCWECSYSSAQELIHDLR